MAVAAELKREEPPLREKLKAIQDELLAYPSAGLDADKAFYEWLNDEEDE
jgi:hypothetical protein